MNHILEISGNHIRWHSEPSGGRSGWRRPLDYLLGKQRLAMQGSFGRDVSFASFVIPERVRKSIWFFLLFLLSLKFYFFRELVAGLMMVTAFAVAVSIPLLFLFAVYKASQNLARREGVRSLAMNTIHDSIRTMSIKDLQLEELLCRLAVNQERSLIMPAEPQKATRNGLLLITELPRRAS